MTDIIDLTAERDKRDGPDADCITHDEYGRPLYTFIAEYRRGDATFSIEFWAYDQDDAQAALAAIERAAYERGVRDAADAVPVDLYHESWMARMLVCARIRILALLTQEGR